MIATDALPHVAHNSTAENRRKGLNLRDIEHLSLCLWCSMALWAKSRLFGQGEGWRIHFKQNLNVTSRAYGLQAELAAPDLAEQFLATRAPDLFAIGVVLPLEPSAARTEPAGLQPGEFVASAGVAQANRELVPD